jgi:hypothetical protein
LERKLKNKIADFKVGLWDGSSQKLLIYWVNSIYMYIFLTLGFQRQNKSLYRDPPPPLPAFGPPPTYLPIYLLIYLSTCLSTYLSAYLPLTGLTRRACIRQSLQVPGSRWCRRTTGSTSRKRSSLVTLPAGSVTVSQPESYKGGGSVSSSRTCRCGSFVFAL